MRLEDVNIVYYFQILNKIVQWSYEGMLKTAARDLQFDLKDTDKQKAEKWDDTDYYNGNPEVWSAGLLDVIDKAFCDVFIDKATTKPFTETLSPIFMKSDTDDFRMAWTRFRKRVEKDVPAFETASAANMLVPGMVSRIMYQLDWKTEVNRPRGFIMTRGVLMAIHQLLTQNQRAVKEVSLRYPLYVISALRSLSQCGKLLTGQPVPHCVHQRSAETLCH